MRTTQQVPISIFPDSETLISPAPSSKMVVALGPGKFYGSSLPRPRIYTDVKFSSDRVDPPVPVMDPLLSWAEEAHWSMGGLSFNRLRLQGRIEGDVNRLRKQIEKQAKLKAPAAVSGRVRVNGKGMKKEAARSDSDSDSASPPPAPVVTKRRRFVDNFEEESEEEEIESPAVEIKKRRKLTRKLAADFEKAADRTPVSTRTRSRAAGEAGNKGSAVEGEENRTVEMERKRKPARKLVADFEKVADVTRRKSPEKSSGTVDSVMKIVEELNRENSGEKKMKASKQSNNGGASPGNSVRSSPRLAKKA